LRTLSGGKCQRIKLASERITGKPEVIPQGRRWPEVGFGEIASDLLQARFWIASGLPTTREVTRYS